MEYVCPKCGKNYKSDNSIPNKVWRNSANPKTDLYLCPFCIMEEIEKEVINQPTLILNQIQNYDFNFSKTN